MSSSAVHRSLTWPTVCESLGDMAFRANLTAYLDRQENMHKVPVPGWDVNRRPNRGNPSAERWMETPKSTKAGGVSWTSAPSRSSPTCSVTSSPSDEDEERPGFVSLMDENGIIGLSEVAEDRVWGETSGDTYAEQIPSLYSGAADREGAGTPTEELSYSLSEHPSHTESLCESFVINLFL